MRLQVVVEFIPDPESYPPGSTPTEMAAFELAALQRWTRGAGCVTRADVIVLGPAPLTDAELAICDEPTDLVHGYGAGVGGVRE